MPSARRPEAVYPAFGRRLRELREAKKVPQQELATFSGLTRSSIANIESGKQRVLLHQVLQFANILGVAIADLVSSKLELPQILSTDTKEEMQEYAEKVRSFVAAQDAR